MDFKTAPEIEAMSVYIAQENYLEVVSAVTGLPARGMIVVL